MDNIPHHPPVEEELWPVFYQILKKIDVEYQKYARRTKLKRDAVTTSTTGTASVAPLTGENSPNVATTTSAAPSATNITDSSISSNAMNQANPDSHHYSEELSYMDMVAGVDARLAPQPLFVNKELERVLIEREELRYRQQQHRELRKVLGNLKHENQLPGRPDDTDLTLVLDLDHTLIHTTELNSKTTSFAVDFMAEYKARNPSHPAFSLQRLHFADSTLSDEVVEAVPHVLVYRKSKFTDGGDDTTANQALSATSESKTNTKDPTTSIPCIVPPEKEAQLFEANPNRVRRASEVPPAIAEALPQMMREDLAGLSPEVYKYRWIMFRPGVFRFLRQILRYNEHVQAYNRDLLEKYPNLARDRHTGNRNDTGEFALKPAIQLALYTLSSKHYADAITNMLEARLGCSPGALFGNRVIARETNNQTERTLLYALSAADIVRFIAEDHQQDVDDLAQSLLQHAYGGLALSKSLRQEVPEASGSAAQPNTGTSGQNVDPSSIARPSTKSSTEPSVPANPEVVALDSRRSEIAGTPADPTHPEHPTTYAFFRSFAMHILAMRLIDFCREYVAQKHSQTILIERLHEIINDFDHVDWALSADQVARHVQVTAAATVNLGAEYLSANRVRTLQLANLERELTSEEASNVAPLLTVPSLGLPFSFQPSPHVEGKETTQDTLSLPNNKTTASGVNCNNVSMVCPSTTETKVAELLNVLLNGKPLVDPCCAQVTRDDHGTVFINGHPQSEAEAMVLHQAFLAARAAVASVWVAGLQQFDQLAHVVRGRFDTALQAAFNELAARISNTHELLSKKHAKVLTPLISADRHTGLRFAVSSLQKGLRANRLRPSRCLVIDDNRDRVWNDSDARSNLVQITQFMPFPASHDISDEEYAQLVISAVDYQMASGYSPQFSDFVPISRCLDVILDRLWQASKIPPGDVDAHALVYFDYELESTRQQLQQQQSVISTKGLQSLSGIRLSGPSADYTQGLRHITSPSSVLLAVGPNSHGAQPPLSQHQQLFLLQQQQLQQAFNTAAAADERTNVVVAPRNIYSSRFVHHAVVTPETHRRAHAALVRNIKRAILSNSRRSSASEENISHEEPDAESLEESTEDENYDVVILRSYAPEISAFSTSPAATGTVTPSAAVASWNTELSAIALRQTQATPSPNSSSEGLQPLSLESNSNSPILPTDPLSDLSEVRGPASGEFNGDGKLHGFQIPEAAEDAGAMLSPLPSLSPDASQPTGITGKPSSSVLSPFSVVPHFAHLKYRLKSHISSSPQGKPPVPASNSSVTHSSSFRKLHDPLQPVLLGENEDDTNLFPELFQALIPPRFIPDSKTIFESIPVTRDVRVLLYHFTQAFPNRLPVTIVPSLALTSLEAIDQAQSSALAALHRDPTLAPASHAPTTTYIPPYLFAPLKYRGTLVCRTAISTPTATGTPTQSSVTPENANSSGKSTMLQNGASGYGGVTPSIGIDNQE